MPANPFLAIARMQMKVFRDTRSENRWFRFDGPVDGDVVDLMFDESYAETDTTGIAVEAPMPTAWILQSTVLALAPGRAGSPDIYVNNDDQFVVNGVRYSVESCSPDGYGLIEVKLIRKR